MTATTGHARTDAGDARPGLPEPRSGARWRWAAPRRALVTGGALVAGGAMAAGLGMGVAAATPSTTATSSPRDVPGGAHGPPGNGATRPTVGGKITALHGNEIVVQSERATPTTVAYSSTTTFAIVSGPNRATSASSVAALKVGAFIGVKGTPNADGTVTASSITIGGGPPGAEGGPPSGRAPSA